MTAQAEETGIYVYGILPGDIEVEPDTTGIGDPPSPVRLVKYRDIAALVSDVNVARPLGTPEDLVAHEELLDSSAAEVPVLPMRFGAVVASEDAVTEELLEPNYDGFRSALEQLDGYVEFLVKGRYQEEAILREILAAQPEAAEAAAQLREAGPGAGRDTQMALGELISEAITAKREQDTRVVGDALEGLVHASVVREPAHEMDAVNAAFLVEATQADRLEQALGKLAADWDGRMELRLIGPLAAYDFVGTPPPAEA